jgi:hypothetical protein
LAVSAGSFGGYDVNYKMVSILRHAGLRGHDGFAVTGYERDEARDGGVTENDKMETAAKEYLRI